MEVDPIEGVKLDKKGGFKYMILSDIITRDGRLTNTSISQPLYTFLVFCRDPLKHCNF